MKKNEPKIKTSIVLPIEAKMRVENLAHFARKSTSEVVEDLIMGAQIVPGNKEEKN